MLKVNFPQNMKPILEKCILKRFFLKHYIFRCTMRATYMNLLEKKLQYSKRVKVFIKGCQIIILGMKKISFNQGLT